jgi:hypothetical protein
MNESKKIIEVNATTGEQTERDMTPEEVENWEAIKLESLAFHAAQEAELQTKAAAKLAAEAKLASLGLTPEEIAAITK